MTIGVAFHLSWLLRVRMVVIVVVMLLVHLEQIPSLAVQASAGSANKLAENLLDL